jgi:hypothetical protein
MKYDNHLKELIPIIKLLKSLLSKGSRYKGSYVPKTIKSNGYLLCKSNQGYFTKYEIKGQEANVCYKCVEYAERRAYRKV